MLIQQTGLSHRLSENRQRLHLYQSAIMKVMLVVALDSLLMVDIVICCSFAELDQFVLSIFATSLEGGTKSHEIWLAINLRLNVCAHTIPREL